MRYLRALFVFASDYRDSNGEAIIPDNPVRRLSAKRLWNRVERRTRYIEPEQLCDWWNAVHSLKNKPQYPSREALRDYLLLLLFTGLRRNEALCLRWENVDLQRGTVCAIDTKNRSNHVLPMGRHLWDVMRYRRSASDSDWVFANPLTRKRITDPHRQIVNVVEKSGVPFSPHDLRRTFASIVSRLGDHLSYYTTKRLLNHRTSDVTQGYIQFDLEQLRSAMQAVEDFVWRTSALPSSETKEIRHYSAREHVSVRRAPTHNQRFRFEPRIGAVFSVWLRLTQLYPYQYNGDQTGKVPGGFAEAHQGISGRCETGLRLSARQSAAWPAAQ